MRPPAKPGCERGLQGNTQQCTVTALQEEPVKLPTVFCSRPAVVVGTAGRGWVFRFGRILADPGLRWYYFLYLDPSPVRWESALFLQVEMKKKKETCSSGIEIYYEKQN